MQAQASKVDYAIKACVKHTHCGLVEGGPQLDALVKGAEHELRPLHKQGDVLLVPETTQVLKPGGVGEVVQGDVGLQAKLFHGVQDVVKAGEGEERGGLGLV